MKLDEWAASCARDKSAPSITRTINFMALTALAIIIISLSPHFHVRAQKDSRNGRLSSACFIAQPVLRNWVFHFSSSALQSFCGSSSFVVVVCNERRAKRRTEKVNKERSLARYSNSAR
jgi:hypothetical protein